MEFVLVMKHIIQQFYLKNCFFFSFLDKVNQISNNIRVSIIYEICDAMKAVHKLGIIHRNLKHDKILLDESLHVRICGFGSSKLLSLNEQMQTMTHAIGDVLFMAPELVNEDESFHMESCLH